LPKKSGLASERQIAGGRDHVILLLANCAAVSADKITAITPQLEESQIKSAIGDINILA
jgi:hypothetical protein